MTTTPLDTAPLTRRPSAPVRRDDPSESLRVLLVATLLGGGGAATLILLRASPRLRRRPLPAGAQLVGLGLVAVVTVMGLTSAAAHPADVEDPLHEHVGSGQNTGVEDGEHI